MRASDMNWGPIKDRVVEAKNERARCWIKLDREGKVVSLYVKTMPESISKFFPDDEFEETLDGAKLRAEIEVERYYMAEEIAKLNSKRRV
jgi:hypothetical protein